MELYKQGIVPQDPLRQRDAFSDRSRDRRRISQSSLGLVSTLSFPVIVSTADAMLKSSGVTLIGYEKIGSGQCTAIVRGAMAEVRIAVQVGVEHAKREGQLISSLVIPRPFPNLEVIFPIGSHLLDQDQQPDRTRISNEAIGLLETRGFPAMVGAADAMLKAANVEMIGWDKAGSGMVTAFVKGDVAAVKAAVDAGAEAAGRVGSVVAVHVIARPHDDLGGMMPKSKKPATPTPAKK